MQGTVNGLLTLTFAEAPSRSLLPDEIRVLKEVYGDSLDYAVVRIKRGGVTEWVRMTPHVVGNIVYLTNTWSGRAVFQPDGSLTREGLETLEQAALTLRFLARSVIDATRVSGEESLVRDADNERSRHVIMPLRL